VENRERVSVERKKVYVLKDEKLRLEVIQSHYNILVAEYGER